MKWKAVEGFDRVRYARYIVPNFASNSVFIESESRALTVISPGKSLLAEFADQYPDLDKDGGKALTIVMPNSYHYLGVLEWRKRYPKALLCASEQAASILLSKGFQGVSIDLIKDGDAGPLGDSTWRVPPGHRGGDVWLIATKDAQRLWVTCDSFLNYPKMSNQPIARLTQKLMGAAPGLKLSKVIKYLLLTDRAKFKVWCLDVIRHNAPTVLLPSHGEVRSGAALAEEIETLVTSRL